MEDLLTTQNQIMAAMQQLLSNFKKDGAERKTAALIKKRLDTLESYWQEFHNNHLKLSELCDESHPYLYEKQYEQVLNFYTKTKMFIQSYKPTEEKPKTPLLNPPVFDLTPLNTSSFVPKEQGTNSRLDDMLRKQASNFRALKRTIAAIDLDSASEKWELEDLLKTLQTRWNVIDSLHWELDSELEGTNESYEREFSKNESIFNSMKRSINSKIWSVAHREYSTPRLDIPVFSGNYHQWVPFKDLFTESIHNNRSLSNAQKMQFLKSKVKGESERLIQHLQISSDNYSIAWEILNHRYNNKKLIFTSHINILMNLPISQQVSVNHIKKIHDTTKESLNAIKNLGVDVSTWDPLIVHILSQKLDNESHNNYIQSLKHPRDLPTLQEFLDFLEATFTSMESSRKKQENFVQQKSSNQNNPAKISKPSYYKQSFASNRIASRPSNISQSTNNKVFRNTWNKCPLCNNEHGLYYCQEFLDMSPIIKRKTVAKLNLCSNCLFNHNGKSCVSEKRCRECNGNHNSILHEAFVSHRTTGKEPVPSTSRAEPQHMSNITSHVTQQVIDTTEILLATALIKIQAVDGTYKTMRALIDQGSQISIISENAAQILALPRQSCKGSIFGVGVKTNSCKGVITLSCSSMNDSYTFQTSAFIMQNLIKHLPNQTFSKPRWSFIDNIQLADPDFNISRQVDILLGADVYSSIILSGICREGDQSVPIAQQTRLGWILCGSTKTYQCNVVLNNIQEIERFWKIEDISEDSNMTMEDNECIEFYQKSTKRHTDGKYEVRLPLKRNYEKQLGKSKHRAIAQFLQTEKKFYKNENIAKQYKLFINEYLALGHMKPADTGRKLECYLPHHCVHRAESTTTSLRVVFNGSDKTSSGLSLNDTMHSGPNLQQDLQSLLLRWRQYEVAFTADIEKMFRQIWVHDHDQQLQKIIWRDSIDAPLQEYQLCTVTYGTKAAPFLAMMTLKRLASDERINYQNSQAIKALEESFYMDDLLHGCHSVTSAITLQQDLIKLLKSGGFNLRKWNSNKPELIPDGNKNTNEHNNFDFKQVNSAKTLGLRWNSKQDNFTFQSKFQTSCRKLTKRSLLSEISTLFDPLGWLTPITTTLKLLFQRVWERNMRWDDELPEDIMVEWNKIKEDIINIDQLQIQRWLGTQNEGHIELHGFCDSSEKAYGCVIYCKIIQGQQISVVLVAGKARLVPCKKTITMPRLELSGALLLSKLMQKVKNCLSNYTIDIYGWCDSTAVLGWLHGEPERWKPFVANRVRQIIEIMPANCWHYVKSVENPADCASRGLTTKHLKEHSLWWQGPSWLLTNKQKLETNSVYTTNEEARQVCVVTKQEEDNSVIQSLLDKQSSLTRIVRILAWVLRFKSIKSTERQPYLTLSELRYARHKIIKHIQNKEFSDEISSILKHNQVSSKSKIANLNPFLDQEGILRVDGRLENAHISSDMKHPIIIPRKGRLTELIIEHAHKITFHGGARVTSAFIRQKYWIVGGNRATKKSVRQCVKCCRQSPSIRPQLMGDLPPARSNPSRPFYHTGVDYTGFVDIKANKGRGIKTTKGYVAVFVCMATKAVHLELVSDLTASAFLSALRRMAARRGAPRHIYCDNGTNFVGANRILQDEFQHRQQCLLSEEFMATITEMNVEFHFNAPSWPSAGGLWEAAVKSLKYHVKRVIGEQKLTFEEYATILAQLEACLNSRPLCALTEDVEDLNFLTPSHFLTGTADVTILETEHDARTRWQLTEKLMTDIWKRWKAEYLTQLTVRSKWLESKPNIEIGNLVTVQDDNLPTGKWLMGRVTELHPGKDGHVRVVSLKTRNGIIKRPVSKLSILPLKKSKPESGNIRKSTSATFLSLAVALIMFMNLFLPCHCNYTIKPIQNNQSLYFDSISKILLIRDDWKLVMYYDMQPYWEGTTALDKYMQHMTNICTTIKGDAHCDVLLLQLRHSLNEFKYYNHMLLGKQTGRMRRRRRGLINGVGYLANSLFGVLDDHFAEQYEKDITLVRENHKHLARLLQNQTSIIEAEYNMIKRSETIMNKQHKIINQHLNALDNKVTEINSQYQQIAEANDFTSSAFISNNLLITLKSIQDMLVDTITDIYHGKFNIHLINPTQLQEELNVISGQLPKDLSLPISNIQLNLRDIYQFLKVKARLTENYFIFEIRIPLVSRDTYDVYRVIQIPHIYENGTVQIVPVAEYVAINLGKDTYIPIKESDLQDCMQYNSPASLCHLKKPIYQRKSDKDLCLINKQTKQCETSIAACKNKWTELNKLNTYLYVCCDVCTVRILCDDQITVRQFSKVGVITLENGCIIKGEEFSIYSHKEYSSTLKTKPEIYAPEIVDINHIINITMPTLAPTTNNDSMEFHTSMSELGKRINEISQQNTISEDISYHDIHHYTIIYLILAAAIVGCVVYCWRRYGHKSNILRPGSGQVPREPGPASTVAAVAVPMPDPAPARPGVNTPPLAFTPPSAPKTRSPCDFSARTTNKTTRTTSPMPMFRNPAFLFSEAL